MTFKVVVFNFCNDQGKVPYADFIFDITMRRSTACLQIYFQKNVLNLYLCLDLHKHLSLRVSEDDRNGKLALPLVICNSFFVISNKNMHVIHSSGNLL